jgi:hypothetical protein
MTRGATTRRGPLKPRGAPSSPVTSTISTSTSDSNAPLDCADHFQLTELRQSFQRVSLDRLAAYHRPVQLDFAVIADGVQQRPDGKLDIFGAGFDTILAQSAPARHLRIVVVVRVLITRAEARRAHAVDVILRPVGGEPIAHAHAELGAIPGAAEIIPTGRLAGIGLNLAFNEVVFPEFGAYEFAIQWDEKAVRRPIRLFVAQTPEPES